jgi:hypothetical protein
VIKKLKKDNLGDVVDDFFKRQEEAQRQCREHEQHMFQCQLEAARENRQQDFSHNMTMMREMMGFMLNATGECLDSCRPGLLK